MHRLAVVAVCGMLGATLVAGPAGIGTPALGLSVGEVVAASSEDSPPVGGPVGAALASPTAMAVLEVAYGQAVIGGDALYGVSPIWGSGGTVSLIGGLDSAGPVLARQPFDPVTGELGESAVIARMCQKRAIAAHDDAVAYFRAGDCRLVIRQADGTEEVPDWAPSFPTGTEHPLLALTDDHLVVDTSVYVRASGTRVDLFDYVAPPTDGNAVVEDVRAMDGYAVWDVSHHPPTAPGRRALYVASLGPDGISEAVRVDLADQWSAHSAGFEADRLYWTNSSWAGTEPGSWFTELRSLSLTDLDGPVEWLDLPSLGESTAVVDDGTVTLVSRRPGLHFLCLLRQYRLDNLTAAPLDSSPWLADTVHGVFDADHGYILTQWFSGSGLVSMTGGPLTRVDSEPVVSAVDLPTGPTTGGTRVVLRGSGFRNVASVTFGGAPGSGLVVESDRRLSVVTPPGRGPVPVVVTTSLGSSPAAATAARYTYMDVVATRPVRVVDDRSVPANTARCATVAGTRGVPATVTGLMVNVTTVRPGGPGNLVLYPATGAGVAAPPNASTVNFEAGQDVANAAFVDVGPDGRICYATRGSAAGVLVDVTGYLLEASGIVTQSPQRLLDTRAATQVGAIVGPVLPETTVTVPVAGHAGVPADATAVLLNVTVPNPTSPGHLRVFPGPGEPPEGSTVNYAPGREKANGTVVPLAPDGTVSLWSGSAAPVEVVLDVTGYVTAASELVAVNPVRVLDTRTNVPFDEYLTGPNYGTLSVPYLEGAGVVPREATALVINVTAVGSPGVGNLRVYPDADRATGVEPPEVSTLNFIAGRDIANQVVMVLPSTRQLWTVVDTIGTPDVDIVIDVLGYVVPRPPA